MSNHDIPAPDELVLNYDLMHPGADSNGGDPNSAYCLDGVTPMTIRKVEIWKLNPTNQGFLEARENRIWAPDIE